MSLHWTSTTLTPQRRILIESSREGRGTTEEEVEEEEREGRREGDGQKPALRRPLSPAFITALSVGRWDRVARRPLHWGALHQGAIGGDTTSRCDNACRDEGQEGNVPRVRRSIVQA